MESRICQRKRPSSHQGQRAARSSRFRRRVHSVCFVTYLAVFPVSPSLFAGGLVPVDLTVLSTGGRRRAIRALRGLLNLGRRFVRAADQEAGRESACEDGGWDCPSHGLPFNTGTSSAILGPTMGQSSRRRDGLCTAIHMPDFSDRVDPSDFGLEWANLHIALGKRLHGVCGTTLATIPLVVPEWFRKPGFFRHDYPVWSRSLSNGNEQSRTRSGSRSA